MQTAVCEESDAHEPMAVLGDMNDRAITTRTGPNVIGGIMRPPPQDRLTYASCRRPGVARRVMELERFSERLQDEVDADTVIADIRAVVHHALQPAHTSIWLRVPERR